VREAADEVGGLLQADQERERRAGTDGGSVRRLEVDVLDRTRRATSLPLLVSSPSVSSRRRPTLPRSTRGQRRMRSQKLPNQAGRYRRGGRHEGGRERGKGLRIALTEGTRQPASQIVGRPACLPATSTLEEHGSSTDFPPTTDRRPRRPASSGRQTRRASWCERMQAGRRRPSVKSPSANGGRRAFLYLRCRPSLACLIRSTHCRASLKRLRSLPCSLLLSEIGKGTQTALLRMGRGLLSSGDHRVGLHSDATRPPTTAMSFAAGPRQAVQVCSLPREADRALSRPASAPGGARTYANPGTACAGGVGPAC
jgi:hypothetical protein